MLLADAMELFFLDFMASGPELTVITEYLNASSFLWRLRLMVSGKDAGIKSVYQTDRVT